MDDCELTFEHSKFKTFECLLMQSYTVRNVQFIHVTILWLTLLKCTTIKMNITM